MKYFTQYFPSYPKEQYEKEIQKYAKDVLDAGFDKGFTTPMNIQEVNDEFKEKYVVFHEGYRVEHDAIAILQWLNSKLQETYQQGRKDGVNEAIEHITEFNKNHFCETYHAESGKNCCEQIKSSLTKLV